MFAMRIVFLVILVVDIWALVDAAIRPAAGYVAAGKLTKPTWLAILGGAIVLSLLPFLAIVGVIAAIVYLVDVRPAIREITGRGGGGRNW